jgi:hypothetical protein
MSIYGLLCSRQNIIIYTKVDFYNTTIDFYNTTMCFVHVIYFLIGTVVVNKYLLAHKKPYMDSIIFCDFCYAKIKKNEK